MKTYQSLKYVLFAGIMGVWGCSSQQYSQNKEYDDLYFSSKDREQVVLTASSSAKDYSNIENKGVASEDYSQKNVNPEYIQQYADQNRQNSATNNSDSYSADNDAYYDENYSRNNNPINLARGYERYNTNRGTNINVFPSIGFGGYYGGAAFYDPFYDPFFFNNAYYDPFFYRPFYGRPGWNINISYNYGWGSPWGWGRSAYWHDPFYNPYRAWGYWGDPYYSGFYGRPYYGWGGGWNRGGNVIIVNPSNGNNNDSRQVRYSPRSGRGSSVVNDNFNNTPRSTRDSRGGRIDQTEGAAGTNPAVSYPNEGRRPANVSADESRPARAVRPRSDANPDYQPQNTQPSHNNNAGSRTYSPNVNSGSNDGISTNPRAVRPRSNNDSYQNQNSNRSYDYNSNSSSAPTYNSTPSTGRSPRSSDNSRTNNNWNNSSNDTYRSNGGFNNNSSSGSYSSPSSAPSRGSGSSNYGGSNGGSSGSSPRRSPR